MNGLRLTKFFVLGILFLGGSGLAFAEGATPSTGSSGSCADGVVVSSIEFKGLEHTKPRVV